MSKIQVKIDGRWKEAKRVEGEDFNYLIKALQDIRLVETTPKEEKEEFAPRTQQSLDEEKVMRNLVASEPGKHEHGEIYKKLMSFTETTPKEECDCPSCLYELMDKVNEIIKHLNIKL